MGTDKEIRKWIFSIIRKLHFIKQALWHLCPEEGLNVLIRLSFLFRNTLIIYWFMVVDYKTSLQNCIRCQPLHSQEAGAVVQGLSYLSLPCWRQLEPQTGGRTSRPITTKGRLLINLDVGNNIHVSLAFL